MSNYSQLVGKTISGIKLLPTIETALQSSQDVETLVVEFSDGSVMHIAASDGPLDLESISLNIKIV